LGSRPFFPGPVDSRLASTNDAPWVLSPNLLPPSCCSHFLPFALSVLVILTLCLFDHFFFSKAHFFFLFFSTPPRALGVLDWPPKFPCPPATVPPKPPCSATFPLPTLFGFPLLTAQHPHFFWLSPTQPVWLGCLLARSLLFFLLLVFLRSRALFWAVFPLCQPSPSVGRGPQQKLLFMGGFFLFFVPSPAAFRRFLTLQYTHSGSLMFPVWVPPPFHSGLCPNPTGHPLSPHYNFFLFSFGCRTPLISSLVVGFPTGRFLFPPFF